MICKHWILFPWLFFSRADIHSVRQRINVGLKTAYCSHCCGLWVNESVRTQYLYPNWINLGQYQALKPTREPIRAWELDTYIIRCDGDFTVVVVVVLWSRQWRHIIKNVRPCWNVTQLPTKVALVLGSPNSPLPKMSTTDHQQPSEFNQISLSDEEKCNINPSSASAEQIVHNSSNSYPQKNLTIIYFIYSYAMPLGELHYCNTEYHNSSMYVPKLSILLFNTYFISSIMWMPDMPSSLW